MPALKNSKGYGLLLFALNDSREVLWVISMGLCDGVQEILDTAKLWVISCDLDMIYKIVRGNKC